MIIMKSIRIPLEGFTKKLPKAGISSKRISHRKIMCSLWWGRACLSQILASWCRDTQGI